MPQATKEKVTLEMFQKYILPKLKEEHEDVKALQSAITDGYDIVTVKDGKEAIVDYKVSAQKEANPGTGDGGAITDEKIADIIAKSIAEYAKQTAAGKGGKGGEVNDATAATIEVKSRVVPEGIKLYKKVKSFTGTDSERNFKAFRFGQWFLGGVLGFEKQKKWCQDQGVLIVRAPQTDDGPGVLTIGKAQSEGSNPAGGILVPEQIENDMIDLREMYGVFRANARVRPMTRDTLMVPRRTSGVTSYFSAEAGTITDSTKGWDNVELTAKKLAALVKYSSEVLEDAIISIADDLADEIVYAFSLKEDQCGFIGDGSSTYGGIEGISNALTRLFTSTSADSAGVEIATGNAMDEVTDGDLMSIMGNLPEYADDGTAAWYCSRVAAFKIFARLLRASGGTTPAQAAGALPLEYGGYPIKVTQVMPRTDLNSQVLAVFGSMKKAVSFGDRRQTTIAISDQRYFENDQVAIRGTERFDINVHDVGDGTNAGAMVGLRAAAS